MPTVQDITSLLQSIAPPALAANWDNVGLLLGDSNRTVTKVMTCLTVTPPVVTEAVDHHVNLIVAHHPVLFRGTKQLTSNSNEGRLLLPLLANQIAVYSAHTAYDDAPGGINDGLCTKLGLVNIRALQPTSATTVFKFVVFVPEAAISQVMEAMFAAGAGAIGNYIECGFRTPGLGTFFGNDLSNPAVGQKGRREEVAEMRFETIVPGDRVSSVVSAMRKAHPYEEPAFDIFPLHPGTLRADEQAGKGRIGELPKPVTLKEFANTLKTALGANGVQFIGEPSRTLSKVAIACGAAGEFLSQAIQAKADVFVTGELRFHEGLKAEEAGVAVVLPGHYATERPGVEDLAKLLAEKMPGVTVWASRAETDPFQVGGPV